VLAGRHIGAKDTGNLPETGMAQTASATQITAKSGQGSR